MHKIDYIDSGQQEQDMSVELYHETALAYDLPEYGLCRHDIVRPVEHHRAVDGSEGYSVEVLSALGDTLKVVTVLATALEPLREDEILCVRSL